jgi:hypothetical protein
MVFCKYIKLHNESSWPELDIDKIISNLNKVLPNNVIEKENNNSFLLLNSLLDKEKNFAFYNKAIVRDLKSPSKIYDLNYYHYSNTVEKNDKLSKDKKEFVSIMLYDGFVVQKIVQNFIENDDDDRDGDGNEYQIQPRQQYKWLPKLSVTFSTINIMITDKLLCTFDETDWRYHARSLICGNPTLISTSGVVEGLAKPRDYYYKLFFYKEDPHIVDNLTAEYKDRFISYNDPRINDVIEGLVLQSIFYFINLGDPFCADRDCRFFNAHFQDDIIRTNIKEKKLCQRHKILLNKYNKSFFNNNCFNNAK